MCVFVPAGKRFLFWWGTEPRLTVTEPELIKEIVSSKFGFFEKSTLQQKMGQGLLGKGLVLAQGQDWANQRRVVGPAFHTDKLKVSKRASGLGRLYIHHLL